MSALTAQFRRELPGWGLRGCLCALPSAVWAYTSDFNRPVHIAAMATGVMVFIAGYAWFSAREATRGTGFVRALKMAAWIKAGTTIAFLLSWFLPVALSKFTLGGVLIWGAIPDLWCGMGSLAVGETLNHLWRGHGGRAAPSFATTLLTTLVQGVLLSVLLVLLAWLVMGWWRLRGGVRLPNEISPVRSAD